MMLSVNSRRNTSRPDRGLAEPGAHTRSLPVFGPVRDCDLAIGDVNNTAPTGPLDGITERLPGSPECWKPPPFAHACRPIGTRCEPIAPLIRGMLTSPGGWTLSSLSEAGLHHSTVAR